MFPNNYFAVTYFPDNYFGPAEFTGGRPSGREDEKQAKREITILKEEITKPKIDGLKVEYNEKSTQELIERELSKKPKPVTLSEKLDGEEDIDLILAIVEAFDE